MWLSLGCVFVLFIFVLDIVILVNSNEDTSSSRKLVSGIDKIEPWNGDGGDAPMWHYQYDRPFVPPGVHNAIFIHALVQPIPPTCIHTHEAHTLLHVYI